MKTKTIKFSEKFDTYEEFVDYVTQQVHSALLEDGGKGMRRSIHRWLNQALQLGYEKGCDK